MYEMLIFGFIKWKSFVCFIVVMLMLMFAFYFVWCMPGGPFSGFLSQLGVRVVLLGFAVKEAYK